MREIVLIAIMALLSVMAMFTLVLISTMPPFHDDVKYRCTCNDEYQPPVEE